MTVLFVAADMPLPEDSDPFCWVTVVATGTDEVTVDSVSLGTPSMVTVVFIIITVGVLLITVVSLSPLSSVGVGFKVGEGVLVGFLVSALLVLVGVGLVVGDVVGVDVVESEVEVEVEVGSSDVLVMVGEDVEDGGALVEVGSSVLVSILSEEPLGSSPSMIPSFCLRTSSFSRCCRLNRLACVMAHRTANTASSRRLIRANMMMCRDIKSTVGVVEEEDRTSVVWCGDVVEDPFSRVDHHCLVLILTIMQSTTGRSEEL